MLRLLPLLLVPAVAVAQTSATTPLVIQVSAAASVTLYPETCSLSLGSKWFSQVTQPACEPLKLWATAGECGDTPGTDDVRYNDVAVTSLAAGSGDFSVKVSALPGFKAAATPCGGAGFEVHHKVCGAIAVASGLDCTFSTARSIVRATPAVLTYDSLAPAAPTLEGLSSFDSAFQAFFSAGDDAVSVQILARASTETDFQTLDEVSSTSSSVRITGVTNEVTYVVHLISIDASGNTSVPSNELEVTPHQTNGFWANYVSGGGGDQGCSATGLGGPLVWLSLLAFAVRRKR